MGKKPLDYQDLELRKIALQLASAPNQPAAATTARAKELHKFLTSGKKIKDRPHYKDEAKIAWRADEDEPVETGSTGTVEPEAVPLSIYGLALKANEIGGRVLMPDMLTTAVSAAWRDAAFKLIRTVLDSKDNVIDTEGLALNVVEATLTEVISLANKHGLSRSDTVTVGQVIDAVNTLRARG